MTHTTLIEGARQFGAVLSADLLDTRELAIAVAFAKQSALTAVDIENWCGPGRSVRLLAGLDYALTELELLRRLELTGHASCRVYHSIGGSIFHFFFNHPATTEIYTLSLHDALPILATTFEAVLGVLYLEAGLDAVRLAVDRLDRKSTRLNSSHVEISYAVFCLK